MLSIILFTRIYAIVVLILDVNVESILSIALFTRIYRRVPGLGGTLLVGLWQSRPTFKIFRLYS